MNSVGDDVQGRHNVLGRGLRSLADAPGLRNVLELCLFETAFYFAYRYGMSSFRGASASPFWYPDSVLLSALLMSPPRRWWIFVLAPLPIRLFTQDLPLEFLVATFAIDSAKGLLAATALRRFVKNPLRLETVREFGAFCLFAVLLIPGASALAGAAAIHFYLGYGYWAACEQWFLGDALAQLVVTPAILYLILGAAFSIRALSAKRCMEGGLLAVGLMLTCYMAFNTSADSIGVTDARFYAPVPFLFWAAVRFGMFGASGAVAVIAFFSVHAALDGRGPFSGLSPDGTALALQNLLLLRAAPLYLVAVLVEQRRSVELSLRESEERFRSMANTAPVMIWTSGPDKRYEFFNQGWLDFTGCALQQALEIGFEQSMHREDVQQCAEVYHSAFDARRQFEMECRLRRHDGEYRWILNQGVPRYAPNGAFVGYIGSAIDITDRKRAEEVNRNLAHTQRLAIMGELTAMIAHEINQPLTAMLSNAEAAEILLERADPPLNEIRAIISDIRKNDLRADEAIRRIRALLRKRETQMQPLDINGAVSDALELVAGDALRRRVRIVAELAWGLSPVLGDRVQLEQVLLNLIINAMDAMADTPVSARHLTVQTRSGRDDSVEVAVTDSGSGIAPDRLASVFESFYTTKKEGMGLGLSIARSIITAHQGRIWAENNSSGGATFYFSVPAARDPAQKQTGG